MFKAPAVRESVSKDSGIAASMTSHTRRQHYVSESEESYHTCQSGSVVQPQR